MTVVLNADGAIPVPKELREQLGFTAGSILELHGQAGALIARQTAKADAFDKWRGRGKLPQGLTTDEYLILSRDGDCR